MAEDPERARARERERYASLTPEQKKAKGDAANARVRAKLQKVRKLEANVLILRRAAQERYRATYGGEPLLDFVPFRMWLILKHREYGTTRLAEVTGLNERQIRRYLDGFSWEGTGPEWCGPTPITSISIDLVDKCLQREGSVRLEDLYPHVPLWDE